MYNWSTDTTKLRKDKSAYALWRLEQLVNYGLGRDRLDRSLLKRRWSALENSIDGPTRRYLSYLLWPKKRKQKSSPKSN